MAAKPAGPRKQRAPAARPPSVRPSLQYSILCDAVQALPDGTQIIVRPWDTINRLGTQPTPVQFVILDGWTSGVGVWTEHVTISDPTGNVIAETDETSFWLQSFFHKHNVAHRMVVAPTEPGLHLVRVFLNNQVVLEYRFKFVIHDAPSGA